MAILFGSVFLVLQSAFALIAYLNALDDFENDRKRIRQNHLAITETLTEDSFLILEQFAELISLSRDTSANAANKNPQLIPAIAENWAQWQLIWDIENIAFFDNHGVQIGSWGEHLINSDFSVKRVLKNESPGHQIFCPENCFQQVIIPVMGQAKIIGVVSVIRPFSDVIIKYKNAAESDIGILIADHIKTPRVQSGWAYKLSAMTEPQKNAPVFEYVSQNYPIEDLLNTNKRVERGDAVYEVLIRPIQKNDKATGGPFFFFVDDITEDIHRLNSDLKRIWLYGLLGLSAALFFIILALHVSLRRITRLSTALPLLSKNHFSQFRKQIPKTDIFSVGYDELDKLSHTALTLADQLEFLEQKMHGHTFNLLEKSQELAKERDFIRQLFQLAPIIIIIQTQNGIILKINHAGLEGLEAHDNTVVGKVFELFIPEDDEEHLKKLTQLRAGENGDLVEIDGHFLTETGKIREISWLHKLLASKEHAAEKVVLSLGFDIIRSP
ncbi:MAG: cache domain-containing protein [Methyloglobulus sp.]